MDFIVHRMEPENMFRLPDYVLFDKAGNELFRGYGIVGFRRELNEWVTSGVISGNALIHFSEDCRNEGVYVMFASSFQQPTRNVRNTLGL